MRRIGLALVPYLGALAAAAATKATYKCQDGARLMATFVDGASGSGGVELAFSGGETINVPQAPSADGGRYAGGGVEFWIKGRSATLTRAGRATTCETAR